MTRSTTAMEFRPNLPDPPRSPKPHELSDDELEAAIRLSPYDKPMAQERALRLARKAMTEADQRHREASEDADRKHQESRRWAKFAIWIAWAALGVSFLAWIFPRSNSVPPVPPTANQPPAGSFMPGSNAGTIQSQQISKSLYFKFSEEMSVHCKYD